MGATVKGAREPGSKVSAGGGFVLAKASAYFEAMC